MELEAVSVLFYPFLYSNMLFRFAPEILLWDSKFPERDVKIADGAEPQVDVVNLQKFYDMFQFDDKSEELKKMFLALNQDKSLMALTIMNNLALAYQDEKAGLEVFEFLFTTVKMSINDQEIVKFMQKLIAFFYCQKMLHANQEIKKTGLLEFGDVQSGGEVTKNILEVVDNFFNLLVKRGKI